MTVTLRTTAETAGFRVDGPGVGANGALCSRQCRLELTPGSYVIFLDSRGRTEVVPLHVTESSDVLVRPANPSQRSYGIGLMAAGGAVFAAGLVAATYDGFLFDRALIGGAEYRPPVWVRPLELSGLGGLVLALIGADAVVMARPRAIVRSQSEVAQSTRAVPRPSTLAFAPVVTPGGAGLRLDWRF